MNKYLLTLKNKIIIQNENGLSDANFQAVVSFLEEADKLGYSFDNDSIQAMLSLSSKSLKALYDETINTLSEMKGSKNYRPMYQNFPMDVKSMSSCELFINQMVHYYGVYNMGVSILPSQEIQEREVLKGEYPNKLITLGFTSDVEDIKDNLLKSNIKWSENQLNFIKDFINYYTYDLEMSKILKDIPNKENRVLTIKALLDRSENFVSIDSETLKTATDVLRFYTAISDGDTSLMTNTKYINVKKSTARHMLSLLNNTSVIEDMFKYRAKWLRIGEKLHPMSKTNAKRFPIAAGNFNRLRNEKFRSLMSGFERLKSENKHFEALAYLATENRNGDLVRNFYNLYLNMDENQRAHAKGILATASENVSTKVLFDAYTRFISLKDKNDTFFIRGGEKIWKNRGVETKKSSNNDAIRLEATNQVLLALKEHPRYANHNSKMLPAYEEEYKPKLEVNNLLDSEKLEVADIFKNVLVKRFSEKESLGKVFIDDSIRKMFIPFSNATQRSVTPRGSRIPVPETRKFVRNFIYWKNMKTSPKGGYNGTRIDLDLSVTVLNEQFRETQSCSYMRQRSDGLVQSGDITDAPNGASEFIDIDAHKVLANGGRYVCCTVKSYSGQTFEEIVTNGGEAYCGFMVRDDADSGEIFDAKTVAEKVELNSDSRNNMVSIYDLKNNEYIWVDFNARGSFAGINISNSRLNDSETAKAFIELTKPKLGDLLDMHAQGRGERVYTREEADITFGFEDNDIKPSDVDYILGELLGE